uniref:HP domain-containing protein n=1 Tax=Arcella intermedia TaxID=1963864 RepID=A0A6B2KYM9_9EUKA
MNPVLQGFAQYSEAGASTGQLFDPDAILKKTKEQQEKDKERSEAVAKLIQIRGTSRVHARQVLLAAGSLNDANVFVLDDLKCLYIWHGKKCSRMEKATGLDVASRINRQYHGGRMDIAKLESGQEDESFWTAIGGKTEIAPMSVGLVTKDTNKEYAAMDCLYVYDEEGDDLITIEGKRDQKQLNEARSYILDCTDEFYVWHGKKVSNEIKQKANTKAKELFDSKPRQPWTQIERANQGGEPVLFVMKFALWEPDATLSGYVPVRGNVAKHIKQEDVQKMDVKKMYNAAPIVGWSFAMEDRDDGRNGSFIIWSIDSFSKKPIPEEEYGHFYSKKSYIILYSWCHDEKYVIYFWQGEHSSINEKGTSATLTTDVNEKYCYNRAILTRVVQYREPKHMLMCFDHNFVVHRGESRDLKKDTRMYQVRGTDRTNTRVTEIIKTSSSLYTGDVFFVTSPEAIYLWKGKHSNPFSLQYAIAIINKINLEKSNVVTVETQQPSKSPVVNRKDKSPKVPRKDEKTGETTVSIEEIQLARKKMVEKAPEYQYVIENGLLPVIVIEEGQEPEEFWKAIGGKKEYIQKPFKVDPKLFFCESDLGVFNCHRIFDFVQADLLPRKMLILDLYEVVYLWIGKEHNHMGDRKLALELVLEYVAKAPDGRPPNDPKVVKEGFEPLDFGAAFQAFRFSGKNAPLVLVTEALSEFSETYIPYEKLKNKKTLPSTVDTSRLEDYLSNEEFEAVFTMKREEWKDKPLWKRQEEKKKAGLY